jgi:ABC-type dipeptide/oligopeptide/nickel transport system permease subunit
MLRLPHRLFGVDEPGVIFPLGTDSLGRDVFSRLLMTFRCNRRTLRRV